MAALKRAYADIILNTAKESAARVLAAERRALGFQQRLFAAKEEALSTMLRLKALMEEKVMNVLLLFIFDGSMKDRACERECGERYGRFNGGQKMLFFVLSLMDFGHGIEVESI